MHPLPKSENSSNLSHCFQSRPILFLFLYFSMQFYSSLFYFSAQDGHGSPRPHPWLRPCILPLCFFRKGSPNYVYIDLKRSPSNLTLGQCKFGLRSMLKTSKLCQVVYHSTRLDGTNVFRLLCAYSGSKGSYHSRNQCFVRKRYL